MTCILDELQLPITVDDYCKQVDELIIQTFPEAVLLPGNVLMYSQQWDLQYAFI